jgi:hypothetical protein
MRGDSSKGIFLSGGDNVALARGESFKTMNKKRNTNKDDRIFVSQNK